jgi:hypothetical protein
MLNREGYGALKGIWGQETQMDDTIPVCVVLPWYQARCAARVC